MKPIRLFCFPYAGGSASIYRTWKIGLCPHIEMFPVELAGHGSRFKEPLNHDFEAAIDDLYDRVVSYVGGRYAMFGHSMGALLMYAVVERIQRHGLKMPEHLFFSGRCPPHLHRNSQFEFKSESELVDRVLKLGGTPTEFFTDPELQSTFIPILRADFRVLKGFNYRAPHSVYSFPITVLSGTDDPEVTEEDLEGYAQYTNQSCIVRRLEGGHFYLREKRQDLVTILNCTLC